MHGHPRTVHEILCYCIKDSQRNTDSLELLQGPSYQLLSLETFQSTSTSMKLRVLAVLFTFIIFAVATPAPTDNDAVVKVRNTLSFVNYML